MKLIFEETDFIYITTMKLGFGEFWSILIDDEGSPFTDIKKAQSYCRKNFNAFYWGLATYEQMKLSNAQIDNF